MKGHSLERFVNRFRRTFESHHGNDSDLLDRYCNDCDLAAFESLVRKHAGTVVAACRRVLASEADVEDAFQATFLVLMKRAGTIRKKQSLSSWLYGVAHRLSLQRRTNDRRRGRAEKNASPSRPKAEDVTWQEACTILHAELDQLPERYRQPLMLCYLEGRSRDEAAAELGLSTNEVRGALERGRERLRKGLEKRGVTLSAGLLAAATGNRASADGPPMRLIESVLSQGGASHAARALAQGGIATMKIKLPIVLAAVLVAGLWGVGTQLDTTRAGANENEPSKAEAPRGQTKAATPSDQDETVEFDGAVLARPGKPVEGARIHVVYLTNLGQKAAESAITDRDGRFQVRIQKSHVNAQFGSDPWRAATIVARAKGYDLGLAPGARNVEIQLKQESPALTGRLINLEGRPVTGATIQLIGLQDPSGNSLDKFVESLNRDRLGALAERQHLTGFSGAPNVATLFPHATTGADGRFTIPGAGADRLVELLIRCEGVETRVVKVMTRPFKLLVVDAEFEPELKARKVPAPTITYLGTGFELAVNRGRTVTGVVRDAATGKPVPGARVYEYQLSTDSKYGAAEPRRRVVADAEGKYTLHGLPVGGENRLLAAPPEGAPFLLQSRSFPPPDGFGPVVLDFSLVKGVPVTVRGIDKATRKPVRGRVDYFAFLDNESLRSMKDLALPNAATIDYGSDGTAVHFVAPPGDGVIGFRCWGSLDQYVRGTGEDKLADRSSGPFIDARPAAVLPQNYSNLVRVNPKAGDEPIEILVELDRGVSIKGRIVGPDGKSLKGTFDVIGSKLVQDPHVAVELRDTNEFTVEGMGPGVRRRVIVINREKKLAGTVVVAVSPEGPEVKLDPCASVKGRVVDEDGKPVKNAPVHFLNGAIGASNWGTVPGAHKTNNNGEFCIEGFCPGLKYSFGLSSGASLLIIGNKMTFRPGEAKDIGTLTMRSGDE